MDQHQQVGPEMGGYAGDCRMIARALAAADGTLFVALVHRMTKMRVALTLVDATAQFSPADVTGPGWVLVAIVGHGAYWFDMRSFLAAQYVAEKLNITEADAETVCEFLMRIAAELPDQEEVA